jgi:hypothetical protein
MAKNEKEELMKLLASIPASGSFESADITSRVNELLNSMLGGGGVESDPQVVPPKPKA